MGFATRIAIAFGALDLTFKVLVGAGYIQVMGGRWSLVPTMVAVCAPVWLVWQFAMWLGVRPVDRTTSADDLRRAAARCVRLPTLLASLWSLEWCIEFATITAIDPAGFNLGNTLFVLALAMGPFPLAHALTVWLIAPRMRAMETQAQDKGIQLELPSQRIRSRMLMYAVCLVIAPSAYMAAVGVAARIHVATSEVMGLSIFVGFLAITVFAVLSGLLVTDAFTRPIIEMTKVVQTVADEGVKPIDRIPRYQNDELGWLAGMTNEMLGRLERTEGEREAALRGLEELARSLDKQRLKAEHELAIAQQIQTSILPRKYVIDELEIYASMIPAARVGGDYYDILPRPGGGGWIGIGDVSGHGVQAGLIMLMLQSITATLVDAFPEASARELVVSINRVLFANIRHRLASKDFVTFTLLRYAAGHIRFAGAHEDMLVWRAATQTCEFIPTPGPWIGAVAKLDHVMVENELRLEPGDLLVLYTDGITEAANKDKQRFGLERLQAIVGEHARAEASAIGSRVLDAARAFTPRQEDDMTIVVLRQR